MPTRRFTRSLLTASWLAVAALSQAADKPKKEAGFGTTKATGAYLTKEQLRTCLAQKSLTEQLDGDLQKEKAALEASHDEVRRSGEALKARLETIDRSNADAVAAYNEQTQAHGKQIDDIQTRIAAFNPRVEAARTERETFVKDCGNRRYFEEDEAEIRKGR